MDERKAIGRTIRSAYRQGKTIDAIQGMELPASIKQLLKQQAVHVQKRRERLERQLKKWSRQAAPNTIQQAIRKLAADKMMAVYDNQADQLDLQNMRLTSLPAAVGKLTSLKTLLLSNNQLQTVPPQLKKLKQLQYVDCRHNQFSTLPEVFKTIAQWPSMTIQHNHTKQPSVFLSNHPFQHKAVGDLKQERENFLKSLQQWAAGNFTPDVESYDSIVNRIYQAYIHQATELDLSHLNLTSLPSVLTQLTPLKTLKINNNHLYALPENFNHLTQLESLDLANNGFDEIREIPKIPAVLKTMKLKLDIVDPWAKKSAAELEELKDLEQRLKQWVHEAGQYSHQKYSREQAASILLSAYAQKATELQLNNLQLTHLPEGVFPKLSSLKSVVLINNQLQRLPEDFSQLPLENLVLASNQFSQFPQPLESITTLKYLSLNHNQLIKLDQRAVSRLHQLEQFNISHNALKEFLIGHDSVDQPRRSLQNLRDLNLEANGLSQWPKAIFSLTALEKLNLENNQLSESPESLRALPALRTLQIRGNPMLTGPSETMAYRLVRDLSGWKNKHYRLSEGMSTFPPVDQIKLDDPSDRRLWSDTPTAALTRTPGQ